MEKNLSYGHSDSQVKTMKSWNVPQEISCDSGKRWPYKIYNSSTYWSIMLLCGLHYCFTYINLNFSFWLHLKNKMKTEQVILLQSPLWYNNADLSYGRKDTAKSFLLAIITPPKFTNNTFCFIHSYLTVNDFSPCVFNRLHIVKAGLIFTAYFLTQSLQIFSFNHNPP